MPERWFVYTGEELVPANGSALMQIPVSNDAHFQSWFFTMTFPTLNGGVDDGVPRLSVQIRDDATQRALADTFIDVALLGVPGRIRSPGVAGDPSQSINMPGMPFFRFWEANGNIEMDLRSTSDTDLTVKAAWHGYKYPTWVYGPELPDPRSENPRIPA